MPRTKNVNVKNAAKSIFTGAKKLLGGGSSSSGRDEEPEKKRGRGSTTSASVRRWDRKADDPSNVVSGVELGNQKRRKGTVQSDVDVDVDVDVDLDLDLDLDLDEDDDDVNMDRGKSVVLSHADSEEEGVDDAEEETDEEEEDAEDEEEDDEEVHVPVPPVSIVRKSNNDLEFKRGVYRGGPCVSHLLYDYAVHVARDVWEGQAERGVLKCHGHLNKLVQWDIIGECSNCSTFHVELQRTGLCALVLGVYRHQDPVLVSAFVERWHPETNTFQMPWGEMTITLDDVSQLLGVPIRGKAVTGDTDLTLEQTKRLLHKDLGIPMDKIDAEMKSNKFTSKVRMDFLMKQFDGKVTDEDLRDENGVVVKNASTQKEVQFAVRAYLLFFFGCTAFTDTSGTAVPVCYLRLLSKFAEIRDYAWGAALLAYLYRGLGTATSAKVKGVSGYFTLLQAWIYEYFPVFRPYPNEDYQLSMSRAHRYSVTQSFYASTTAALKHTRATIDNMTCTDVEWYPYAEVRATRPVDEIAFFEGFICFLDNVEQYNVSRVMRQLGHMQFVPSDPPRPKTSTRTTSGRGCDVKFNIASSYWSKWQNHLIQLEQRGPIPSYPWECVSRYMSWYENNSHTRMINPDHLSHYSLQSLSYHNLHPVVDEISRLLNQGLQLGGTAIPDDARNEFMEAYNLTRCKFIGGRYCEGV